MKIGLSTSVIQRGKTGIAQYIFALVRALASHASEHQFTLFVLEEDVPLFDFIDGEMKIEPVAERFRPPAKNIFWHQAELPGIARRRKLDVLHVPSYRRLLWRRPCALVATIHDLAPFQVANKYDWKRMFYGRVVARRLARRQDHVIAISQNTADDLRKWFALPANQITVVLNGLEHNRFFPGDSEAARAEAARRRGLRKPFFLYVARLEHPAKNHVRLISAFNQFKDATGSDWQLAFGGSDWNGAENIHAAIKASPHAQDIHCLGFIGDKNLPELYRAAGAFVYPSLYEGFGLPPIEAMACGCPVISSTRGSLAEVVGEAAAKVDPEDIGSITQQLTFMAMNAEFRQRWRSLGLAQAQRFNWQKTADETVAVYQRTLNQRSCGRAKVA